MENKGLLFIPDISGFTKFVNDAEIEHSKLIIQELLEIIIKSNRLGLEVSEIEGDAILFYRFGDSPPFEDLFRQVEEMFLKFHKSLLAYSCQRYCQCRACTSAAGLSLKVITHFGEFTGYNVRNFNKLIGKDVIIAHQLLKNDIEQHEYWLVTKSVAENVPIGYADWMNWNSSAKLTDSGEVIFHYTQLSSLKENITLDPIPKLDLTEKVKVFSFSNEYDTDIITLFHAAGDFNYRSMWQEGIKKVKDINHHLPRLGMKCCCILDNGHSAIYSSSYSFNEERIEFSETENSNNNTAYYILEKLTDKRTRLTIDYYIPKNFFGQTLFTLKKKASMKEMYRKSLINLTSAVQEIKVPSEFLFS